jgi:hypothetical protein
VPCAGIIKLQELLKGATKMRISLRQLKGPDYQDVLKDVRASGESHIILDCQASKVPEILRQAQQLKLTSPYYQYLLTTLVRLRALFSSLSFCLDMLTQHSS